MMTDHSSTYAQNVISFKDVHMVFSPGIKKPVHALRGFNMEIEAGSVVGMLGPNGCGKTTAISCLLGLLQPQQGDICLWGKPIDGKTQYDINRIQGVLLEDTRLPPFLNVGSAITYVGKLRGFRGKQLKEESDRVINTMRIETLLDRRICVLSKGQARRVGVGAALIGDPKLMVLDEPSAGLDVSARVEFNELLRDLRNDKRTILIASHLLSDVETTCTHIAIMREGRIIIYEEAETLLSKARKEDLKDIYIDQKHSEKLIALGIRYDVSRYPGQLLINIEGHEYEVIAKLAAEKIVPSRIEPQANLVSLYLDFTGENDN